MTGINEEEARQALLISPGGEVKCVIVLPSEATAVEASAAEEVGRYVAAVTGVGVPVVREEQWVAEGSFISVGNTRVYLDHLTAPEDAPHDRFIIKRQGRGVLLNGNNRRGVLYAAYRFLETCAGVCFALAGDEYVPEGGEVRFPQNDVMEQADLANREIVGHSGEVVDNVQRLDYLAKNLGNSIQFTLAYWQENREALLPEVRKRGLDVTIGGHIYGELLSEEEHFEAHPEWFPEIGGQRTRGTGQLCYSEGGVEVVVTGVAQTLQDCWAPEIKRFALWFGDNALFCACPKCRELGFYDHYMRLVSKIKAALDQAGMPDVALDFCIYNSDNEHKNDLTLLAPEFGERPAGINIFYSYWGRDYTQPLNASASPFDAHSFECMRQWCEAFRTAEGFPRVGEYYADSNQLTAMAPVIPQRIKDDLLTYKNAGMDGMHVCVHLWWSPGPAYPIFWVMSFNLFAYLRFAWDRNLSVPELFDPLLEKYFGEAAGEVAGMQAAVREAVLPLTRWNLAGPVCSLAGTILWHIPYVPGGPRYSFDPEKDEFADFRRGLLEDVSRGVEIMQRAAPLFEAFQAKAPADALAARNFATYFEFCRGNLRSKLLQAEAQEAIMAGAVDRARELIAEVYRIEAGLYGTGIRDIAQWAKVHRDNPQVKALGLEGTAGVGE